MNNLSKNIAIWLIIAVVLMTVFNQFGAQRTTQQQMPYSQFIEEVRQQQISKVVIEGNVLRGERSN
ncbi:MAG: ATP-dependent metallopeptidase FtsH/Yme1/Tma family protein, partial [Gammaproteobacteria bacterium]